MKFVIIFSVIFIFFPFSQGSEETNAITSDEIFDEDSSHDHQYGRPVSILKFDASGNFIVDNKTMDDIFLHEEVKNRKIVTVSIIGAFRRGKSFLMDYALRYMYGHYKSIAQHEDPLTKAVDWMGEMDEPLKGFSWRGGVARDTNGVIMWSDVFLHEQNGKKLAIILMDTQGLFDTRTSPTDNSRIFALGTLASSIQIFNLNDVILENQLEYLQLATEFSKFAMQKNKEGKKRARDYKPFQNLIFLMRDWQNKQEYEYGEIGGAQYLATVLQILPEQPEPLKNVRKFITKSFEKLYCFLMPHPGKTVVSDPSYEGQRIGLDEEFEEQLSKFLDFILKPRNLVAKKILNTEVTGSEYVEYLKAYFIAFQSNDIPRVDTLHSITVKKRYDIIIDEAFVKFKSLLVHPNYNSTTILKDMEENGESSMKTAFQLFSSKRKLGSPAYEESYKNDLKLLMEAHLAEWKLNHLKTYENLQRMEQERIKEIEEAERIAKEKLDEQKRLSDIALKKIQAEQEERERQMNETLYAIRADSDREISILRTQYEDQKRIMDEENTRIFNQLKQENDEMRRKVAEAQIKLQEEMVTMQASINEKQREMEKILLERRDTKLEELKLQAEHKRMELEEKMKIEEFRQKTEMERMEWERQMFTEERRIREESEAERKREYEKIILEMKQEQKRLQEMMLLSIRSG